MSTVRVRGRDGKTYEVAKDSRYANWVGSQKDPDKLKVYVDGKRRVT